MVLTGFGQHLVVWRNSLPHLWGVHWEFREEVRLSQPPWPGEAFMRVIEGFPNRRKPLGRGQGVEEGSTLLTDRAMCLVLSEFSVNLYEIEVL